jgi:hypothetical protein
LPSAGGPDAFRFLFLALPYTLLIISGQLSFSLSASPPNIRQQHHSPRNHWAWFDFRETQ